MDVSLGTIGTERLWRNTQRAARNKGRSMADLDTVNLLSVCRWLVQVSMRLASGHRRRRCIAECRPDRARDRELHAAWLACTLLGADVADAPLSSQAVSAHRSLTHTEDAGAVHALFRQGSL